MQFDSLDEIKKHPWVGVYHYDAPAIKAAERFALNRLNPVHERAEALRCIIRDAMGCPEDRMLLAPDERLLLAHILSK